MWELWKREKLPGSVCLGGSWEMKDTGWKCWGKNRTKKPCFTTRPWSQFRLFVASSEAQIFLTTPTSMPLGRGSSWQWRSASTWSGTTSQRSSMGWWPPRRSCSAWWATSWTLARGELRSHTLGKRTRGTWSAYPILLLPKGVTHLVSSWTFCVSQGILIAYIWVETKIFSEENRQDTLFSLWKAGRDYPPWEQSLFLLCGRHNFEPLCSNEHFQRSCWL